MTAMAARCRPMFTKGFDFFRIWALLSNHHASKTEDEHAGWCERPSLRCQIVWSQTDLIFMMVKCRLCASCIQCVFIWRFVWRSAKLTRGLEAVLAAGMSRLTSDLLQIIQVSHIPERVLLASADNLGQVQPFPLRILRYFLGFLYGISVFTRRVFFFFASINIIITIMPLTKGRLIIIVIWGIASVFVVIIFILQGAAFTHFDDLIRSRKQKCDSMSASGAMVLWVSSIVRGQRNMERWRGHKWAT